MCGWDEADGSIAGGRERNTADSYPPEVRSHLSADRFEDGFVKKVIIKGDYEAEIQPAMI